MLQALILKLEDSISLPSDYVCVKGEVSDAFYLVRRGYCALHIESTLIYINTGETFGENALLSRAKRTASVYAVVFCEFCVLRTDTYESVANLYPDSAQLIQEYLVKRMQQREQQKEQQKVQQLKEENMRAKAQSTIECLTLHTPLDPVMRSMSAGRGKKSFLPSPTNAMKKVLHSHASFKTSSVAPFPSEPEEDATHLRRRSSNVDVPIHRRTSMVDDEVDANENGAIADTERGETETRGPSPAPGSDASSSTASGGAARKPPRKKMATSARY